MIISKKSEVSKIKPDQDPDDFLMEIHGIYQNILFTEDLIEEICERAEKLMDLMPPETLIITRKSTLDIL